MEKNDLESIVVEHVDLFAAVLFNLPSLSL